MAWFLINFIFWLVMSFMLVRFMQFLASKAHGIFTVRLTLNIPIKTEGLAKMLLGKEVQMEDLMVEENSFIRQCTYQDKSKVCVFLFTSCAPLCSPQAPPPLGSPSSFPVAVLLALSHPPGRIRTESALSMKPFFAFPVFPRFFLSHLAT